MSPKAIALALAVFCFLPLSTWGQNNSAVKTLDNVEFADQWCSTVSVLDGSCLVNAITAVKNMGGGTVDARSLFNMTSTQQIDVGDHTNSTRVTLLLPPTGIWKFNITDGVSCGIRVLNLSRLIGTATGVGSGFSLQPFNSLTNMDSLVCTDTNPSGNGSYVEMSGFGINYNGLTGATFSHGLLHVSHLFDGSAMIDMIVQGGGTTSPYGVLVEGMCCGAGFINFTVNTNDAGTMIPFAAIDPANFASGIVSCINCSLDHPGAGKPVLSINQSAGPAINIGPWNFYNLQSESNSTDLTTALVQVGPGVANFYGGRLFRLPNSTTSYCFQIANVADTALNVLGGFMCKSADGTNLRAINNQASGQTVNTDANGIVPDYVASPIYRYGMIVNANRVLPNNGVNAGIVSAGQIQNLFGTGDLFLEMAPSSTSGWSVIDEEGTLGLALSTFNTHPISIRPNRTETVRFLSGGGIAMTGTAATLSGCGYSGQVGGATAGKFTSGTTGACTVTITPGSNAPNGWSCYSSDLTNNNLIRQSGSTTTGCSITGSTTSGDTINWAAIAF